MSGECDNCGEHTLDCGCKNMNGYSYRESDVDVNDILIEAFYQQFRTFVEFTNDSAGKIPDSKYAHFLIYLLVKRLEEDFPDYEQSLLP